LEVFSSYSYFIWRSKTFHTLAAYMRHMQRFISALSYSCLSVSRIYQHPFVNRLRHKRISVAVTLVEVLIVVAMVGTLAAIGVPAYNNYIDKTRNSQAIEDIRFIEAAIKMYLTDRGVLPDTLNQVSAAQRLDPWGNPYRYYRIIGRSHGEINGQARKDRMNVPINSDFDLYSMGKDRRSQQPCTSHYGRDDIIRANDGAFVGLASEY
jgi:general secretion pathway protein G